MAHGTYTENCVSVLQPEAATKSHTPSALFVGRTTNGEDGPHERSVHVTLVSS